MQLTDVLHELGVDFTTTHHHVSSGWIGIDCPQCSPGWRKYRFGIRANSGKSSCWMCGKVNPVKLLSLASRKDFGTVLNLWQQIEFVRAPRSTQRPVRQCILPQGVSFMGAAHRRYVADRGFDPDYLYNVWQVGAIGAHHSDRDLRWRVFAPIHNEDGIVCSWTARTIRDSARLRYKTASDEESAISPKDMVYGEHMVQHAAFITEGLFDAWAFGPGGCSTLGTAFTDNQIARLSRYPMRVVCYDNSPDAQKRAKTLCKQLSMFPGTTENVKLDRSEDPADALLTGELAEVKQHFGIS